MVFGLLSRQGGGGWARRYLRIRKDVYAVQWESRDSFPCIPVEIFDFTQHDDYVDACRVDQRDRDGWRISDDGVIGGFSKSQARMVRTPSDLNNKSKTTSSSKSAEDTANNKDDDANILDFNQFRMAQEQQEKDTFLPFLRWNGTLNTQVGLQSDAQRSGFCSIRSPEFPFDGANLRGLYEAVEIVCRTDGRPYNVNLKVSTSVPDDIYQGTINIEASDEFLPLVVPFDRLQLTSRGRQREHTRHLDDNVAIESIGFTLMDGQDGDFCFDLARVRAVNIFEGAVFEKPPAGDS